MKDPKSLFLSLDEKLIDLQEELKSVRETIDKTKEETAKFLSACRKVGIKTVCIETSHSSVPSSVNFSFGQSGSVFANEKHNERPAIWEACEISGVGGGCGNLNQHAIKREALLWPGTYRYIGKTWKRISD